MKIKCDNSFKAHRLLLMCLSKNSMNMINDHENDVGSGGGFTDRCFFVYQGKHFFHLGRSVLFVYLAFKNIRISPELAIIIN